MLQQNSFRIVYYIYPIMVYLNCFRIKSVRGPTMLWLLKGEVVSSTGVGEIYQCLFGQHKHKLTCANANRKLVCKPTPTNRADSPLVHSHIDTTCRAQLSSIMYTSISSIPIQANKFIFNLVCQYLAAKKLFQQK